MFGVMEGLIGFFRRQVGLRTDSSNQVGSLHAKMEYLINEKIGNKIMDWKNTKPKAIKGTFSAETYATLCNISGSGFLTGVAVWPQGNRYSSGIFKLTIDGTVIFQDFQLGCKYNVGSIAPGTVDRVVNSAPFLHRFNNNLILEGRSQADSYNTDCDYLITYILD